MKARIFLFYGNDALMSRRSLQKWEAVFLDKHEGTTHHRINLDTLALDEAKVTLQAITTEQALFVQPSLYVVLRPTAQEKGKKGSFTEALLRTCSQLIKEEREEVTLLIWEDAYLNPDHDILKWFREHEDKKQAKIYEFNVPYAEILLEQTVPPEMSLAPDASQYLLKILRDMEKQQRSAARVRSGEIITRDTRRSWLENVVDNLSLFDENPVGRKLLESMGVVEEGMATPFEVANALERQQYAQAIQALQLWSQDDLGDYFVLLGVLRQRYRTLLPQPQAAYAMSLLAELELLSKNGLGEIPILCELFIRKLEAKNYQESLLEPKKVWLAQM